MAGLFATHSRHQYVPTTIQGSSADVVCAGVIDAGVIDAAGLLNVYPQHVALSFSASSVAMSSQVPDGQAAGDNIHTAEREGKAVNYGERQHHN